MKTRIAVALLFCLTATSLIAVEKKDLLGKWIGMKGEYRWQIERFENGTYKLKFRYSNLDKEVITSEGKWELAGKEYQYRETKSDAEGFEPDKEMYVEMVHSFNGSVFVTTDLVGEREEGLDYFNMEIKVEKFNDFNLIS